MEKKLQLLHLFLRQNKITQEKAAAKLGVTLGTVSALVTGRRNFGKKSAQAWADAFGLSPLWLMTGEGDMLQNTHPASTGEAVAPPVYYAPLVSKYAYAGYVRGWGDDEYLDSLPKYPVFVDHEPRGQYIAIEVKGDSMDDGSDRSIKEGAVCLCRLIAPELWRDTPLHVNKWVFVIVTGDGILIKRIKQHSPEAGTLTISSYNPAYPDAVLDVNDIKQIYNVVQITQAPVL